MPVGLLSKRTPMSIPTSATIASSTSIRLRHITPRIRALGDRPLFELFCELTGLSSAAMDRLEAYAALGLHADLIEAHGGRDLPPIVRLVK
jgi:hypothetical protein